MRAYLELLRPANVVTALADVLAGYAVAGLANAHALPWLLVATACLYGGGVVLNDVFDREIDRAERPERPIPSGRASVAGAAAFGTLLLLAGVVAATCATAAAAAVAIAIVALVLSYDGWAKRLPFIGPVNMGACRGANLLLGVAAVPAALGLHWTLALLPLIYIFAVTTVSRGEVHGGSRRAGAVALACMAVVVTGLLVIAWSSSARVPAAALAGLLACVVLPAYWRAARDGRAEISRRAVKTGVLSLVLLDATVGSVYAGPLYALIILAVAGAAWVCARAFAVT